MNAYEFCSTLDAVVTNSPSHVCMDAERTEVRKMLAELWAQKAEETWIEDGLTV